jgi:hypothetical protein
VQVVGAARAHEVAGLDELVGHGDDVGRLAVRVQAEDRLEDQLVLRDVEVGAANRLDDVGHGIRRQQHAAEGGLFGEQIVRRGALVAALRRAAETLLRDVRDRHARPSSRPVFRATRHARHRVRHPQTGLWITLWRVCAKRRDACVQNLWKLGENSASEDRYF